MSILDELAKQAPISRIVYGHFKNNKPNDHCYWGLIGYCTWGWLEDDSHFRQRILENAKINQCASAMADI